MQCPCSLVFHETKWTRIYACYSQHKLNPKKTRATMVIVGWGPSMNAKAILPVSMDTVYWRPTARRVMYNLKHNDNACSKWKCSWFGGKNSRITVGTAISLISCFTVVQDAETITGSMYFVRCISVVQDDETSHACVGYDGHNDERLQWTETDIMMNASCTLLKRAAQELSI